LKFKIPDSKFKENFNEDTLLTYFFTSMANDIFFIGWDAGGMHGDANALCRLQLKSPATSTDSLRVKNTSFFQFTRERSAETLAQNISEKIIHGFGAHSETFNKEAKNVLAIDCPLSLPMHFSKLVSGNSLGTMPLNFNRQIDNKLAYRECETYIKEKLALDRAPLSATFNTMMSLVLLVHRVFHILKTQRGISLNLMPYMGQDLKQGLNVIECYPKLLKTDINSAELKGYAQFAEFRDVNHTKTKSVHEADAELCALFAAHEYSLGAKGFWITKDFKGNLGKEGWIYAPYRKR